MHISFKVTNVFPILLPAEKKQMNKKCVKCHFNSPVSAKFCVRCNGNFVEVSNVRLSAEAKPTILMRITVIFLLCVIGLGCFYYSLIFSSDSLSFEQRESVERSIRILREKGFSDEVFYLENLAAFRGSDNWLNDSVPKESAYASTNYPFEIMTIYPDFFTYTVDDLERAAILLHEAKHLQGANEEKAYAFVWVNRYKLGWTQEKYGNSVVWRNVRLQTIEFAPYLFE